MLPAAAWAGWCTPLTAVCLEACGPSRHSTLINNVSGLQLGVWVASTTPHFDERALNSITKGDVLIAIRHITLI